jgi:hypothetical protein
MSEDFITQRIQELSPAYRTFIESNFVEIVSRSFGEANNFNDRQIEILENSLTFYLLFLFDEIMTTSFIARNCEIKSEDATILFTAIRMTFPDGLNDTIQANATPQKDALDTSFTVSEIEITEKTLENLQNIRTMAADMQEVRAQVPTYQSAQSDLIRPSAPLPPAHSGPHWETDS